MSDRAHTWRRQLLPYLVITVGLVAGIAPIASSASKTATFGFACAAKAVLPPAVKQVVSGLVAKGGDSSIYGDQAVSLRLRRTSEITFFVPLSCDGWGNCKWAIIATTPARSLGVIAGTLFMVKTDGREWPEIYAYSTTPASQAEPPRGAMETLEFKGDGYQRKTLTATDPRLVGTLATCLEDKSCCPPAG